MGVIAQGNWVSFQEYMLKLGLPIETALPSAPQEPDLPSWILDLWDYSSVSLYGLKGVNFQGHINRRDCRSRPEIHEFPFVSAGKA